MKLKQRKLGNTLVNSQNWTMTYFNKYNKYNIKL